MAPGPPRILVACHRATYCGFYDVVLDWVRLNLPECATFDLRALPIALATDDDYRLLVPWLQDPVEAWSARVYRQAMSLTEACDARGVPVVNRVDRLARAGKFDGATRLASAGLRTPRVARIDDRRAFIDHHYGVPLPLFVREDLGHGGPMIRADTPDDLRAVPLDRFRRPVAVELIDLPDPADGLYRKYRYFVAGHRGVPHHIQVSAGWVTRGRRRVTTDRTRADELAYIDRPCPHHDDFQRARAALGLDVVAFDYALDRDGRPVVWEANPYAFIQFSRRTLVYRNRALHRTIAIIVASYLERAGLTVPARLSEYLDRCPAIQPTGSPPRAPVTGCADAAADDGRWLTPPPPTRLERARLTVRKAVRKLTI